MDDICRGKNNCSHILYGASDSQQPNDVTNLAYYKTSVEHCFVQQVWGHGGAWHTILITKSLRQLEKNSKKEKKAF